VVVVVVALAVGWGGAAGAAAVSSFPNNLDGECNEYLVPVDGPGIAFGVETVVGCTMEWPTGVGFDGGGGEVSTSGRWRGLNAFSSVNENGCDASSGSSASFVVVTDFSPDWLNGTMHCESGSAVAGLMSGTSWFDASSTFDVAVGPDESGMSAVSFVTVTRWNLNDPSSGGGLNLSGVETEGPTTLAMPWTSGGDMVSGPEYVLAIGGTAAVPVIEDLGINSIQLGAAVEAWPAWSLVPIRLPSDYYTGGSSPSVENAPCSLTYESLQGQTFAERTSYSVTFEWSGAAGRIFLDPGPLATSSYDRLWSLSSPLVWPSYVVTDFDPSSPDSLGFEDKTTWAGESDIDDYPHFYCEDAGVLYDWGGPFSDTASGLALLNPGTVVEPASTGGTFDWGTCVRGASWDLFSPASWVVGAVTDGKCAMEWLFDPCPQTGTCTAVVNLEQSLGIGVTGASGEPAPVWVGSMGVMMAQLPSSAVGQIQTAADTGGCSAPGDFHLGSHSFSLCGAFAAVSSAGPGVSGAWSIVGDIVAAGLVIILLLGLFHMIRRMLSS
jgi:hypothetical protein